MDSGFRQLKGPLGRIENVLLAVIVAIGALYVAGVHQYLELLILKEQYLGLFLGLVLAATFLGVSHSKSAPRDSIPWFDFAFAGIGFLIGLYVAIMYPEILEHLGIITPDKWILGTIAILLIIEATRRFIGWVLVVVIAVFIFYACYSHWFPGPLYNPSVSWQRLATYLYLDTNGLLGIIFTIGATIVLCYILFGSLLLSCGGGKILTDVALAIAGKLTGGPAIVAVIGSGLFGMLSGSSVANVLLCGTVTIPLMKSVGYKSEMAAAIEASASNGGLIMPPIMGAVAFVMAQVLGITYAEVALAAFLPAILYYVSLLFQAYMWAGKHNFKGLPDSGLPKILPVIRSGWWIILPLLALVYLLFIIQIEPGKAALGGSLVVLIVGMTMKQSRQHLLHSIAWLKSTGRSVVQLGIILAGAALMVGALSISGIGVVLPWRLVEWSGGNVFVLLILAAIVSIILGTGLPVVAAYLILAVLVAPALATGGIAPLAAHFFLMYFGILSNVTPPSCETAFAAAAVAQSSPMRTGFLASQLSLAAYIVPWVFVYNPALLLLGTPASIALAFFATVIGIGYFLSGILGYCLRSLNWLSRLILLLCGASVVYIAALDAWFQPWGSALGLSTLLIGLIVLIAPFIAKHLSRFRSRAA